MHAMTEFQKHEVDYSSPSFLQEITGGSDLITKLNFQIFQRVRIKRTEQQKATSNIFSVHDTNLGVLFASYHYCILRLNPTT